MSLARPLRQGFRRHVPIEPQEVLLIDLLLPEFTFPEPGKRISLDTEYDQDGILLTVGVSDSTKAIAKENGEYAEVRDLLNACTYIVGHSVAGDLRYLAEIGALKEEWVTGEKVVDSLILARM